MQKKRILAAGSFDDIKARHFRFFEEASKLGELNVIIWNDEIIRSSTGNNPKFPEEERLYLLKSIKFISHVYLLNSANVKTGMQELLTEIKPDIYVIEESEKIAKNEYLFNNENIKLWAIPDDRLEVFNNLKDENSPGKSDRKKVIVTGCYDWFHSGHVAFFEEASMYGDLYVIIGSDKNVRLLKGEKHPMFNEAMRRYVVQAIRYVKAALISTGSGWMDAEPEIMKLKPDIYIVNEDGDVPEKRDFCKNNDIEYLVLKRIPKSGLPKRTSTCLRNF